MIYFAVRDKEWLTISPVITRKNIRKKGNSFHIGYRAHYQYNDIDFEAAISIISSKANHFTLEMKGLANSTFMKNRIGFCILHPILNCAGRECIITHPDGSSTTERFPEDIAPHQPFKGIRDMRWKINDALEAQLHFEGDIFETEDQRNWTDASYKTYSTPLDQPYPVQIEKGTTLFQRIEFSLQGENPAKGKKDEKVVFTVGEKTTGGLPDIGVGMSSRSQPLTGPESDILRIIHFTHIRGELHLFNNQIEKQYAVLSGESVKLALPLEICLIFGDDPQAELAKFLLLYHRNRIPVKRIIVFSGNAKVTSNSLLSTVMPVIRRSFPGISAGAGTNSNFAQINRSRPDYKDIDFITFAIHPQEHASDERTLMENTAAQQFAVQCAAKFELRKPVIVSPVTIQRRFNANRNNYEVLTEGEELPLGVDPRQMSLSGAAWTVGSLKYLLESKLSSITYYETVGERGLFMGDHGSRWPGQFIAGKGMIFPVFHVFRMLLRKGSYRVTRSYSTNPLVVDGFAVADEQSGMIFLSNMTMHRQKVMLEGTKEYNMIMKMNAQNFDAITRNFQTHRTKKQVHKAVKLCEHILQPYETMILEYRL